MRKVEYLPDYLPHGVYLPWPDDNPPGKKLLEKMQRPRRGPVKWKLKTGEEIQFVRLIVDGQYWDCRGGWVRDHIGFGASRPPL